MILLFPLARYAARFVSRWWSRRRARQATTSQLGVGAAPVAAQHGAELEGSWAAGR
jgi:hypothetical protein